MSEVTSTYLVKNNKFYKNLYGSLPRRTTLYREMYLHFTFWINREE